MKPPSDRPTSRRVRGSGARSAQGVTGALQQRSLADGVRVASSHFGDPRVTALLFAARVVCIRPK